MLTQNSEVKQEKQTGYNIAEGLYSPKDAPRNGCSNTPLNFCEGSGIGVSCDVAYNCFNFNVNFGELMYGASCPMDGGQGELYAKVSQVEYKTNGRGGIPVDWFEYLFCYFKDVAVAVAKDDPRHKRDIVARLQELRRIVDQREVREGSTIPSRLANRFLGAVRKSLRSPVEYKLDYPQVMPCGMKVTHCVEGACGSRIYYRANYNKQGEIESYECYVYLTQTLFDTWGHKRTAMLLHTLQRDFILRGLLKCIRIDVRIDDKQKNYFIPSLITQAAFAGKYMGVRKQELITDGHGGWTHYFGSAKSESRIRFYETFVKHGYYGVRMERQLRGAKAAVAHHDLACAWQGYFNKCGHKQNDIELRKYLKVIASLVVSGFELCAGWWGMVVARIDAEEISFSVLREESTLRTRGGWVKRQWQNTLAVFSRGLGFEGAYNLLVALIEQGEKGYMYLTNRARIQHDIMVKELQEYGVRVLGYNDKYEYVG